MEWLKDKKNLPIVIGLAVFVLLVTSGLIAFELGAFSGSSAAPAQVASATGVSAVSPGGPPAGAGYPGGPPPGGPGYPAEAVPGGISPGLTTLSAVPAAAARTAVKPKNVDPTRGPDPFYIPGGPKKIALTGTGSVPFQAGMKLPLNQILPPMTLFRLRPPTPPALPVLPGQTYSQTSSYRLSGIINGSDGNINAILEVGGQSQQVKPGDALPDGSRVVTIQSNSVTLRTGNGTLTSLPLSAGGPDQNAPPNQFNGPPPGFNGPPGYNGPPAGYNGPPPGFGQPPQDSNGG